MTHKTPLRLAVLISGTGSNLLALIDAIERGMETGSHPCSTQVERQSSMASLTRQDQGAGVAPTLLTDTKIALVVSNKATAPGLQRALQHNLPAIYLPWKERAESERLLTALLHLFDVDLIILAGWMHILSASFVEQFPQCIINLHPALLPDDGIGKTYITSDGSHIPVFRGLHAVKQALDAGIKVTGSTVHYVTPEVDAGPVLCREEVPIEPGDTEDTLHSRLKIVEHRLIVEAVKTWRKSV